MTISTGTGGSSLLRGYAGGHLQDNYVSSFWASLSWRSTLGGPDPETVCSSFSTPFSCALELANGPTAKAKEESIDSGGGRRRTWTLGPFVWAPNGELRTRSRSRSRCDGPVICGSTKTVQKTAPVSLVNALERLHRNHRLARLRLLQYRSKARSWSRSSNKWALGLLPL